MKTLSYDVVVIGAGGMGAAAAYHLAGDGRRVLLLEQFQVGHKQGSSHGGSRIIRHSHAEAAYASLAPAAFDLWRQLEAESGALLLVETGSLDFGPPNLPALIGRMETMAALGFPYEVLDQTEMKRRFPQFRLADDWVGFYQPGAGILAATRAVETMAAQAVRRGVTLQEESRVLAVTPEGDGVVVEVDGPHGRERIHAAQSVITAGPWAGIFLSQLGLTESLNLPLKVTHQQVAYFETIPDAQEMWNAARSPVYISLPMPHFYGFPIWERPGQIKVALELHGDVVDPDTHDRRVLPEAVDELSALVAEYLSGVIPKAVSAEACLYTQSPDQEFIIDRHPQHPQILFAAGFSGRGFKFTILTGRLLADLAATGAQDYSSPLWREIFRIDRLRSSSPVHADLLRM
ncbi:MAG: N-methyl-L-tryptophan oxidase [Caldilineaceae bacterium]|nr:N-methyl-L-tryptophan oxidase [Caldilineaceae bacterium]